MEFSVIGGLAAGLIATVVMSAMMKMSSAAGMTQMPPMPLLTGSMLSGDRDTAIRIGVVIHYIMMGTVVFGLLYAAILSAVGGAAVLTGSLTGLAHGVIVGAIGMPMMPAMHPRMGAVPTPAGGSGRQIDGELDLPAPGLFGVRWGAMTPAGLVIGHVVYGLVFAVVYLVFV